MYKQIGNAVPVNLGYHVGLAARKILGVPAKTAEDPARLMISMKDQTLF